MTQIENSNLNIEERAKKEVFKAVDDINVSLDGEYSFRVYGVWVKAENQEVNIEIDLGYVVKLMEISEAVSEGFSEYISGIEKEEGRELSEEEVEKLYNELYENELSELNNIYTYYVEVDLKYDLSEIYPFYSGILRILITPLECDGDYCDVGSSIIIEFKSIRIETIEKASEKFRDFLADLLRLIHSIITL